MLVTSDEDQKNEHEILISDNVIKFFIDNFCNFLNFCPRCLFYPRFYPPTENGFLIMQSSPQSVE